jgi:hypothetical protein
LLRGSFLVILATLPVCPGVAAVVDWAAGCQPFLPQAERYYHLPAGLLQAIALTESGQDGEPYPWSLNIGGQAVAAPSYQAAARLLRDDQGRPRRDVAVGCMQIHMQYHLNRFVDPEWALHPRYNVWYAAEFLDRLRRRHGSMVAAVAHYHGSDPAAQAHYLCLVASHLGAQHSTALPGACPAGQPTIGTPAPQRPPRTASRQAALLAARRVGRIIVLGDR